MKIDNAIALVIGANRGLESSKRESLHGIYDLDL